MCRTACHLGFFFSLLVLSVSPQLQAQYSEQMELWIANVDVVVTDANGKPVRGLTSADFEVYENGRLRTITNFSAVDAARMAPAAGSAKAASVVAGTPPKTQPRLIAIFVDIGDIEPYQRQKFFEGVRKFLHSSLREGDVVTVLTWIHRVRGVLEPTSNQMLIDATIDGLSAPYGGNELEIMHRIAEMHIQQSQHDAEITAAVGMTALSNPDADKEFEEWVKGEERCATTKRKLKEMRNLLASFSRVDMQKLLVFASDDISLDPNPAWGCRTAPELDALANTANAYGITIHAFHPPGAREDTNGPDRGGFLPAANAPAPLARQYERAFDESGGLLWIARMTGGLSGVGALQSARLLEEAATELDAYYSIGFRMEPGSDDKPRNIKVTTRNRKYRVRTRQSVVHLSEPKRVSDLVTANLYLPEQTSPRGPAFDATVGTIKRDGRFRVVPLTISIHARDLVLLPSKAEKSKGSFSIFVAGGRELGDASDVAELKQELEADSKKDDDTRLTYSFSTRVRPDTLRLSIAVRDNISGDIATKVIELPIR